MPGRPLRVGVVAMSILVLTNGPLFLVARRVLEGSGNWEDPVVRSPLIAISLVAVGLVALDRHRVSDQRLARPSLWAAAAIAVYSVLAVLSTYWSLAPDLTLWRATTYLGLPCLAWVIADLDHDRWRQSMTIVLVVALAASLLILVVSPTIGLDKNDDWRGIYTNRNSLAPLSALGVIVGVGSAMRSNRGQRYLGRALAIGSGVVLLGTGSRTAWLALLIAVAIGSLVVITKRVRIQRGPTAAAKLAGGLGVVGVGALGLALSRLWTEPTFEQRRTIWSLVWDRVVDRPLHGHGFFAVWELPEFTSDHFLLERGSAHGSALEVWLGLGLLGLVPFAVIVGLALFGVFRDAWRWPSWETWVWLVVILFLLIENITESFVLWFSYNWVLVMAAALRSGMRKEPDTTARARPDGSPARSAPREPIEAGT